MRLLQPKVDITPGTPGTIPPGQVLEGQALPGSVAVRLVNNTNQEGAYRVSVECAHGLWQQPWAILQPLPAPSGSPATKHDLIGPQREWAQVHVPNGGTRDVLVRFHAPRHPSSRAGEYALKVHVVNMALVPAGGGIPAGALTEIPLPAVIRPYYQWELDLNPPRQNASPRRRRREYEVTVKNEGNDWLYCDLQLPTARTMKLMPSTTRIAVPPPDLEDVDPVHQDRLSTQRSVPLLACSDLRTFHGVAVEEPIVVSAERVDAPSIPPPPVDPALPSFGNVLAQKTSEVQPGPPDRLLVFHPTVPAWFTNMFRGGWRGVMNLVMVLVGLFIAFNLAVLAFHNLFRQMSIQTLGMAEAGKPLVIKGKWLQGSRVTLTGKKQVYGADDQIQEPDIKPRDLDVRLGKFLDPNRIEVKIPPDVDHLREGKILVQRVSGILSYLTPLLPHQEKDITVGDPLKPKEKVKDPTAVVTPDNYDPEERVLSIRVKGLNLGDEEGRIDLEPSEWVERKEIKWSDTLITIRCFLKNNLKEARNKPSFTLAVYRTDERVIKSDHKISPIVQAEPDPVMEPLDPSIAPLPEPEAGETESPPRGESEVPSTEEPRESTSGESTAPATGETGSGSTGGTDTSQAGETDASGPEPKAQRLTFSEGR